MNYPGNYTYLVRRSICSDTAKHENFYKGFQDADRKILSIPNQSKGGNPPFIMCTVHIVKYVACRTFGYLVYVTCTPLPVNRALHESWGRLTYVSLLARLLIRAVRQSGYQVFQDLLE